MADVPSYPPSPGFYEREMYRGKAAEAVWEDPRPVHRMAPVEIVNLAADAAVAFDRERMALVLRERVLTTEIVGLPAEFAMVLQEFLFDLADQIEAGMIHS
jgi:hypothetical protein